MTLTLRQWDRTPESDPDWHHKELPRIAAMIADGYTSGEIIGENGEGGWWEFGDGDGAASIVKLREAVAHQADAFDADFHINGADMVEWFGGWRAEARALLGEG